MIWVLYLAAVVASAIADERAVKREIEHQHKIDYESLRYDPKTRVHNYNPQDKRQNEILRDFNSPDYHQPTLVLDYRYLRTGGRQYIQGPTGQYIILPHKVKSPQDTKFRNFDELLDDIQRRQRTEHDRGDNREDYERGNRRDNDHRGNDRHMPDLHDHDQRYDYWSRQGHQDGRWRQ